MPESPSESPSQSPSESPSLSPSASISPSESPSESPSPSPTPSAAYSNADILDDDLSSLTGWTNADNPAGVSSQVAFDGRECFQMYAPTTVDQARRHKDLGSLSGSRYVVTVDVYFDLIATLNNRAFITLGGSYSGTDWGLQIYWRTDTCTYATGDGTPSYSEFEAGTSLDTWHLYTFDIRADAGTFSIYKNGTLIANDLQLWINGSIVDGRILLGLQCQSVANLYTYFNYVQIGTDAVATEQDPGDPSASESASESPSISPSNAPGPGSRSMITIYTFP